LAEYFEISELAMKEAEKSVTEQIQKAPAHVQEEVETAFAPAEFLDHVGKFSRDLLFNSMASLKLVRGGSVRCSSSSEVSQRRQNYGRNGKALCGHFATGSKKIPKENRIDGRW
jgi:hypothetical protein